MPRPKIVLFGDSITQKSFTLNGWGSSLVNKYARNADVVLRGYSGFNTRCAVHLLDKVIEGIDKDSSCLFIIGFGANDAVIPSAVEDDDPTKCQHVPLDEFLLNIRYIIDTLIINPSWSVLLMTPPPVTPMAGPKRTLKETCKYVEGLLELSKDLDVVALDIFDHFVKNDGWSECFLDGLHLNEKGNQVIYEAIESVIDKQFEEFNIQSGTLCNDVPMYDEIDMSTPDTIKRSIVNRASEQIDEFRKMDTYWRNRDLSSIKWFDSNSNWSLNDIIGFPSYFKDRDNSAGLDITTIPVDHEWHLINGCFQSTKQEDWRIPSPQCLSIANNNDVQLHQRYLMPHECIALIYCSMMKWPSKYANCNLIKDQKVPDLPKLRWYTLGHAYDWTNRSYIKSDKPNLYPKALEDVARRICGESLDTCIINLYRKSDRLRGHVDDAEDDPNSPLVTVSLGEPALFLLGKESKTTQPDPIWLRNGDIIYLRNKPRRWYHGISSTIRYCMESNSDKYKKWELENSRNIYSDKDYKKAVALLIDETQWKDVVDSDAMTADNGVEILKSVMDTVLTNRIRINISMRRRS